MNNQQPLIDIRNVSKIFGDQVAVDQINLQIFPGEFFSLLGSSGSGKSTLLRLLAGFELPSDGKIFIDGQDITNLPPYERPLNMMFQSYALFPHMTVEQNIAFGLKQDKLSRGEIALRVEEILRLVELTAYRHRKPARLSGGQCQRVALARCLVKRPKVLLLDEPLSALDKKLREQMQFQLVDIQEALGTSFLMVTHDQAEAMTMSTRIGLMHHGRLLQTASPTEIYEFPTTRFSADFMGKVNLFECQLCEGCVDDSLLQSREAECNFLVRRKVEASPDQSVWIGLRPEKVLIDKNPPDHYDPDNPVNCIRGVVNDIAYLGGLSTYHVKIQEGKIIKATDFNVERRSDHPTWEDTVYLSWEPDNAMVLLS